MADGTVTLSLDQYESMQDEIRQARSLKTELENEKAKLWQIFGPFFDQPRKVETILENYNSYTFVPKRHFRLTYKNPYTKIDYNEEPSIQLDDETKGLIIRMLIERHIADVIKNIDFKEVEFQKW